MNTMPPERWARLKEAFALAVESGADAGDAACAGDPELRSELESLLRERDRAPDIGSLSEWALPSSGAKKFVPEQTEEQDSLRPGDRVAGYTIESLLGRGGMGEVYRAMQDNPRRAVALKVIRAGQVSARGDRRLEAEAEMLARLHHPGIAGVIEAGRVSVVGSGRVSASRPFFSMELVEGEPIMAFAEKHQLDIRKRVELARLVCDAVEHAHQRGIIHRDLKPANILVDASGRPRVLDFGIAKFIDDEQSATQVGLVLGTPAYMSPEQAAGLRDEVDTRSDVYSFGVVLFELLTGRLPYSVAGKPSYEVLRIVREQGPMRPSAIRPELRGDLETIMLAALEKDPARRYASVGTLGEDLRRWGEGEPISMRPPRAAYLLRLFARKRWRELTVAGIALGCGLAIASWQYAEAHRARRLADERLAEVRRASRELVTGLSAQLWNFESVAEVRRYLAAEAMRRLDELAVASGGDPATLWDLSIACHELGMAAGHPGVPNTGDRETAVRALTRALEIREQVLRKVPRSTTYLCGVAKTASSLAMLTIDRGPAAALVARSTAAYDAALRLEPSNAKLLQDAAYQLAVDGALRAAAEEAFEPTFENAIRRARAAVELDPNSTERACTLGTILSMHATAVRKSDTSRAMQIFAESTRVLESVLAVDPKNYTCVRHIARAKMTVAGDLRARGEKHRAMQIALEVEQTQRAWYTQDPTDTFVRLEMAAVMLQTVQLLDEETGDFAGQRSDRIREVKEMMRRGRPIEQLTGEELTRFRWAESLDAESGDRVQDR